MARLRHPLLGADLGTLVAALAANRGVAPACLPHAAMALGSALFRWPFDRLEAGRVRTLRRRPRTIPPPVIIVGHWRSGTTHLHQLLACDPQFVHPTPLETGLPWNFMLAARTLGPLLERALPRDRYVDALPVTPGAPQEDEIALANMVRTSFLHGVYFPRRFRAHLNRGLFFDGCTPGEIERWQRALALFADKLTMAAPGRRLLLKNPAHSPRVAWLRTLWPDARFIHIVRNPYLVYGSTVRFWGRMLAALALQRHGDVDVERCVLDVYPRLMRRLLDPALDLGPGRFVELRLEDLVRDPLDQVARVYAQLGLEGFERARARFAPYLELVRDHRPETTAISPEGAERVDARWRPLIERWSYDVPLSPR